MLCNKVLYLPIIVPTMTQDRIIHIASYIYTLITSNAYYLLYTYVLF